ncbi:MAG: ABC transporter ATP-binding protein [Galactobacter sp.]
MTNVLEVKGLHKTYRMAGSTERLVAVKETNLTLAPGGSVALVGESGSGKSTNVRVLMGLERGDAGTMTLDGTDYDLTVTPKRKERRVRSKVMQMVFQDPYVSLDPRQSIGAGLDEVLKLHTTMSAQSRKQRIIELLESVRLPHGVADEGPGPLSGGQRQRVAIARALAAEPKVLVLDEALSALDVATQNVMVALLRQIQEDTGVALLFISHDLPMVAHLCEEVLVLHRGTVVESGPTSSVLSAPQEDYTKRLLDAVPRRGWTPRRRTVEA